MRIYSDVRFNEINLEIFELYTYETVCIALKDCAGHLCTFVMMHNECVDIIISFDIVCALPVYGERVFCVIATKFSRVLFWMKDLRCD